MYVLSYYPRNGSDLTIKLFFDLETFQHLRTEYRQYVGARQGSSSGRTANAQEEAMRNSARQQETRNLLTE